MPMVVPHVSVTEQTESEGAGTLKIACTFHPVAHAYSRGEIMRMRHFAARMFVATLVASLGVFALPAKAAHDQGDAAVIIEWNQLAQRHVAGPPFAQNRSFAMVHVAMADAVVAIEGRYDAFHVSMRAPGGASAEAAAAQAAHDVLVFLVPGATAASDAALATRLATISPGKRSHGVQVGQKVAAAVLAWRANDGFAAANPQPPTILASTLPGIWRPTASGPAQFSKLGDVEPFGLLTSTQFLPTPYPQLESAKYAEDFNEVKNEGRRPSSFPAGPFTANQRTALLWAGGAGTPYANVTSALRLWHNVARDVAQAESLSLVQTARLFALLTTSIHDSVQTSHTSKFAYRLWRPETAIDQAGVDNNPNTAAETGWVPLLLTPPYPSHSSNMTCIGAGAGRMLANIFNTDAKSFTVTWYASDTVTPPATTPPVVHSQAHNSFRALAQEEGDSRIWGGIHFRFEIDASLDSCSDVADYLFDNYMQSRAN